MSLGTDPQSRPRARVSRGNAALQERREGVAAHRGRGEADARSLQPDVDRDGAPTLGAHGVQPHVGVERAVRAGAVDPTDVDPDGRVGGVEPPRRHLARRRRLARVEAQTGCGRRRRRVDHRRGYRAGVGTEHDGRQLLPPRPRALEAPRVEQAVQTACEDGRPVRVRGRGRVRRDPAAEALPPLWRAVADGQHVRALSPPLANRRLVGPLPVTAGTEVRYPPSGCQGANAPPPMDRRRYGPPSLPRT